jgi:hypothetical protein
MSSTIKGFSSLLCNFSMAKSKPQRAFFPVRNIAIPGTLVEAVTRGVFQRRRSPQQGFKAADTSNVLISCPHCNEMHTYEEVIAAAKRAGRKK